MALPTAHVEAQVANMTEPGHEVVRHNYIWIRDSLENLRQERFFERAKVESRTDSQAWSPGEMNGRMLQQYQAEMVNVSNSNRLCSIWSNSNSRPYWASV